MGLIDILPTASQLAKLPSRTEWQGRSLRPLLLDPAAPWDHPILSTFGPGNHAVCDERWRCIRYHDGSEELYDLRVDPHEWHNLIDRGAHMKVVQRLKDALPDTEHPPLMDDSAYSVSAWWEAEKLLPAARGE